MTFRAAHLLAPVVVLSLSMSACGSSDSSSPKQDAVRAPNTRVESHVIESLERSVDASVRSVTCPEGQSAEPGATFTCEVDFSSGLKATATLRVTNGSAHMELTALEIR